jgi:hypothetical protein
MHDPIEVQETMVEIEGFTIEEAVLTYKQRQKLPSTAFCGPKRTYPAHDAEHVRSGLQRLSQFFSRMKPSVRKRIFSCLSKRAKRHGITISDDVKKKFRTTVQETNELDDRFIAWYIEKIKCKEC